MKKFSNFSKSFYSFGANNFDDSLNNNHAQYIKSEYVHQYDFNKPVSFESTNNSFPPIYQADPNLPNQANYNLYMCNLPPTPGISPPNSQPFHSQHKHNLNSPIQQLNNDPSNLTANASQSKGRPKKRKATSENSTQSNKKHAAKNSKQLASPALTTTMPALSKSPNSTSSKY